MGQDLEARKSRASGPGVTYTISQTRVPTGLRSQGGILKLRPPKTQLVPTGKMATRFPRLHQVSPEVCSQHCEQTRDPAPAQIATMKH